MTCFEWCRNLSIHPSRCNTGSETNRNRNALSLLHIIKHIKCYMHTYKHTYMHTYIHTHTHSFIGMCRKWRFLVVPRSFFHSSLLCTLSLQPIPPARLLSFFTLSCHLFLGLPLSLVVSKFTHNTILGILFSSILCTCPN